MTALDFDDLPEVMTAAETMAALRLGRGAFYRLVRSGDIPAIKLGRSLRFSKQALRKIIDPHGYWAEVQERMNPGSTRVHGHGMTPDELFDYVGGGADPRAE